LEEKKGHRYLIQALEKVAAQGNDFRCLFIGEGPLRESLGDQVRDAGLGAKVELLGGLPRAGVLAHLRNADVMVLPSIRLDSGKQEGIPVALMEGMAMELPVIATNISGIPELVEDRENGLLVPERDAAALAAGIIELYQDTNFRHRLGRRARQVVLADFDLHKSAQVLYDLIQGSAQARGSVAHKHIARDLKPEPEGNDGG
jgi:glycosyltransferase involved in cell wall biosynthesis